ncbi:MAG: glycosyltransferase family 2 protein [Candidatus Yanofskybacteria bacterium]|nr:glycosyltransferase family 2 protein [Candidatus Yanofskybacteria bacterium]
MRLSVIIPAYNEESRLPKTLEEVDKYLKRQPYEYEIIVVNDGSKDGTAGMVKSAQKRIQNLILLDNKQNHGKGYVVRQGMLEAKGDLRLFMDADNATSVDQVERMWPELEQGYEVVIGSRDLKESVIAVRQPWIRQRLGDVFNIIVQAFSGLWGYWDTQCGFKGFTAKAAEDIFARTRIDRWAFDVEALVLAKKLGYGIREIPVTWINDPNSKVKLSGMVNMLGEVLKIRWNSILNVYGRIQRKSQVV